MKSDKKRYMKYYKINPFDKKHYDIVMDTTGMTAEKNVKEILKVLKEKF